MLNTSSHEVRYERKLFVSLEFWLSLMEYLHTDMSYLCMTIFGEHMQVIGHGSSILDLNIK